MPTNHRILFVEDTDVNARLFIAVLEKAGYEVTLAVDGVQAVKYGEIGDFDLILMDVNMPEMDGLAATQKIRAGAAPMRAVPIIGLTADDDPAMHRRCVEAGMNSCLSKPIQMTALLKACEHSIEKTNRKSA